MRIDLPDGQWAELRERITHAEDKQIKRARRKARDNPEETWDDLTVALRVFVTAWNVRDLDGQPIDLSAADAMDRCPMDIADILAEPIITLYSGATVPNEPTPPSSAA